MKLKWHKLNGSARNGWRAWAIELDPTAPMPSYYRITQARPNFPERHVDLNVYASSSWGPIPICTVTSFEDAKARAQKDYDQRIKRQIEELR